MVNVASMSTIRAFAVAADYLKTRTEKYVRLPKLLDFFRFSVDCVATVTARSGIKRAGLKSWVDKCIYSRGTIARPVTRDFDCNKWEAAHLQLQAPTGRELRE
jgi:hypothetical protein